MSAFSGTDCLGIAPSAVDNITSTKLQNAIFDHMNVTSNTNQTFNTVIPTEWDYDTILNAPLDDNVDAGNVGFAVGKITAMRIKRRVKGTFDWITIAEGPVNSIEDLEFNYQDKFNASGVEYEYAFVPVLNEGNAEVEGDYIINSIQSQFDGVFIADGERIFKLMYGVEYGTTTRNITVGTFEPLGRPYPIVVANGLTSYDTGSVTGTIVDDDFGNTAQTNPEAIVQKVKSLKEYLTNHKAKVLKDWNGNLWLCTVTGKPTFSYLNGSSMSIPQLNFQFTEIGDIGNYEDWSNNGLVGTLQGGS